MADKGLTCTILTPDGSAFEGDATYVEAHALDGRLGILSGHAPLITALGSGPLRVRTADGDHRWQVDGGFLEVLKNDVSIIAEKISAEE
ncbi:MAG TPA: ATP synthase F1 subunit epsilon [Planctomycetes bacterium]|nr:ATP synthase F1 subunit epsilon [Planctomycetota bacterium]HIN79541.1 ATP synthase F1 subunit epsilon [Planctomycetota bacterium]